MFIAALCIIALKGKQSKYSSTNEWRNKMRPIRTTECYLTMKRKEILVHATVGLDLGDITLSERSQTRKAA